MFFDSLEPFEEKALGAYRIKNPHKPSAVRDLLQKVYVDALAERHSGGIFRMPHSIPQMLGSRDEKERYDYAFAAKRRVRIFLEKQHREEKRLGEECMRRLTDASEAGALRTAILTKTGFLPEGSVCAISYDIPECQRAVRNALRYFLIQIGCLKVHYSLWKTNRDLMTELRDLFAVRGAEGWIKVFSVR